MTLLKLKQKQLDPELEAVLKTRPPIRLKVFLAKRYHRKKLLELSLKSLGQVPQLEEPDQEWVERRMRGSARSWEVWDAGKEGEV